MPDARWALAAVLALGVTAADLPLEGERTVRFETETVTWLSLDVSPDGARIVLEAVGDLYTLPIEGGRAERITSGMAFDSQPRFSPDGEDIVFISDRDGSEAVWVSGADGSDPRKIGSGGGETEFASPSWSPDGSHVVVSKTQWGLGTFEVWAYHVDGGKGVRITRAKSGGNVPIAQRANTLGAVYSPDGRYLYYARKNGGFGYGLRLPLWQVARRDLREGTEDTLTDAVGSAMRPLLSPDGTQVVYATRHETRTGLRIRNLNTGVDRWLAWPVQRDEQESRFTRDLFPGYAFTPDGRSVVYTRDGGIWRVDVASGETAGIPFELEVEQSLGPELRAPQRLGLGPVKARLVRGLAPAPDGGALAFSALGALYVHDVEEGRNRAIVDGTPPAVHPAWSPDGRWIVYATWSSAGGHLWRIRSNGRGAPRRLTEHAAFYSDPAWSPDGERIVALRGTTHDRLYREWDSGTPFGSDVIWLPSNGGETTLVLPARGLRAPHSGPEADRIYLYASEGPFTRSGASALTSVRYDGTDRRVHLGVKGPGIYFAEENVPAEDIRLAPDGGHALVVHAQQLYVLRLLNRHLSNLQTTVTNPSVPLARLTDVGVDEVAWSADGRTIHWSVGSRAYARPLDSVEFRAEDDDETEDGAD
ncbi:MAG: amidohydrolase, partial [Gammaproteobacteria bacterium]|nr:amidohydrolase [Gammaproteobacteria bacterium]